MLEREKFRPPLVRADLLSRQRLLARARASVDANHLTLIIAPAGSGKSVLANQIMQAQLDHGGHCAWLNCDEFDGDRRRFLSSVLQAINPALARNPEHISEVVISADDPSHIVATARASKRRIALFLDNFHFCENESTLSALNALISESDGAVHFVVTSRTIPRLALGQLRLRGLIGEFDAEDLAFTDSEASEFVNGSGAATAANDALSRIVTRTEGWAAAVQLARILVQGGADLRALSDSFCGADKDLVEFLNQEVFQALPKATQEFLIHTTPLDRISIDLAAAATGSREASEAFHDVIARNLFVSALDRQGEWIRLHSVFRDYLMAVAKTRGIDTNCVLANAADWYAQHDQWIEAIGYPLRCSKHDLAVDWLSAAGDDIVQRRGETAIFLSYCLRLTDTQRSNPALLFWMIWASFFSSDYDTASTLLAKHASDMEAQSELAANAGLLQFLVALFTNRFEEAASLSAAWLREYPNANGFNRATAAGGAALAHNALLQQASALRSLSSATAAIATAESDYGLGWICAISAILKLESGRAQDAREELEAYLDSIPSDHNMRQTIELVLAEALYEIDDLGAARALIERNLVSLARHSIADTAFAAWRTQALVALHDNGPEAALQAVVAAMPLALRRFGDHGGALLRLLHEQIILLLPAPARRALKDTLAFAATPLETHGLCPLLQERAVICEAQQCLIAGNARRAITLAQPILNASATAGRLRTWVEASCVKAGALGALEQGQAGVRILVVAIERTAPLGMRRSVLDRVNLLRPLGPHIVQHLSEVEDDAGASATLCALAQAMNINVAERPSARADAADPLTARELRVLELAAEGLSNARIASSLAISLATVKTHLYNAFVKLNADNRVDAIARARTFGFIR